MLINNPAFMAQAREEAIAYVDSQIKMYDNAIIGTEYGKDYMTQQDFANVSYWKQERSKMLQYKANMVGVAEVVA